MTKARSFHCGCGAANDASSGWVADLVSVGKTISGAGQRELQPTRWDGNSWGCFEPALETAGYCHSFLWNEETRTNAELRAQRQLQFIAFFILRNG